MTTSSMDKQQITTSTNIAKNNKNSKESKPMNTLADYIHENQTTRKQGFKPVLTVRSGVKTVNSKFIKEYKGKLRSLIEQTMPEIITVEYKERLNLHTGLSAKDYSRLLKAACKVAHAQNVKCTNGGLEDEAIPLHSSRRSTPSCSEPSAVSAQ